MPKTHSPRKSESAEGRAKAVEMALTQIKDKFGEGSIMQLSEAKTLNVDVIPSGSLSLDLALGVGGIPRGRIIEIYGPESSGKTTLSRTLFQSFNGEEDNFIFHMILDPNYKSEYQFLASLTNIFKITPDFRSTIDHREAIEKYLFQKGAEEGKTIVLLIDEGQKLGLWLSIEAENQWDHKQKDT